MPLERVVGEANLRRTDVEGIHEVRLVSKASPSGRVIANLMTFSAPPEGGFAAAGNRTLTVMVEDVDDAFTRNRVLRALGIDCRDD